MDNEENFIEILQQLDKDIREADNPKHENYINRTKTMYDYVAELAGLLHKYGNVYVLAGTGKIFIRTKFGFQPAEVFNKGLELTKLLVSHEELQVKYEQLRKTHENTLISKSEFDTTKSKILVELAEMKNELDKQDKLNGLYFVTINELTELKKELTLQIKTLSEKNSSLIFENLNLKKLASFQAFDQTIKYNESKITKLFLKNKRLPKEISKKKK